MRLWTVHPKYLDARGLVALWREGLLAKHVILGRTKGYRSHPQLDRFRAHAAPAEAIDFYLSGVLEEARCRGYQFDASKLDICEPPRRIAETRGQLMHEWRHLLAKLRTRDPALYEELRGVDAPLPHPFFRLVAGGVRTWERAP